VRSRISDELLMNIFDFISTIVSGIGLVCISPKMSKKFVTSTKVLSMFKTFSLSMIEST
jgi:hypothetical protein